MPKIRDLGINVIPATMRPPEIGKGAYYMGGGITCDNPSGKPCVPSSGNQPCDDPSVRPPCDNPSGKPCSPPSAEPCDNPSGVTGPTGQGGGGKRVASLGADAIAQLRQQMQGRLGARL
jgi:hypothetical protein